MAALRAHWEDDDVHGEVDDVVEHGPFLVGFVTASANRGGRRISFSTCSVNRVEDGKVVETWTLRGSDPVPVDAG